MTGMAGNNGAIVIKRIKKGGHGGHHGGAWKVAYADFVTAMMAFFLLMWLINTTTPEQKRGIADYFAPQSIAQTVSGSGGVLGGKVMGEDSAHAGGAQSVMQKAVAALADFRRQGPDQWRRARAAPVPIPTADTANGKAGQDGDFAHAAEAIHQSVQDNPDIANLSHQVITENTPQGLRIQSGGPGRPSHVPERLQRAFALCTRKLLAAVGGIISRLPNRVSIAGHTGGNDNAATGSSWELSASSRQPGPRPVAGWRAQQ